MIFEKKPNEMPRFKFTCPKIEVLGRAIPEDAQLAWYPFIQKLEKVADEWESLEITFMFDFFNSSSSYFITRIFYILDDMRKNKDVIINWYYIGIDEDMQACGEEYLELFPKLKINLISRK